MAAPIQTLALSTHYSIIRKTFAPKLGAMIGAGVVQARRKQPRPVYGFTIHNTHAIKSEIDAFYGFFTYHQADIPFYYDGGPFGTVTTPALVGFGDGARTHFFLPNRNITTSTMVAYLNDVLASPQPTIDLAQGLLTFGSAVTANVKITASYSCVYKCVFDVGEDLFMNEENFYSGLFKVEGIQLREMPV